MRIGSDDSSMRACTYSRRFRSTYGRYRARVEPPHLLSSMKSRRRTPAITATPNCGSPLDPSQETTYRSCRPIARANRCTIHTYRRRAHTDSPNTQLLLLQDHTRSRRKQNIFTERRHMTMKNIHILCIIAMMLMGMASSAMAKTFVECGCDRFLAGGLFKTKKSITEQSHKNIFKQFLCSADEGLIQQVSKDKASLGFSVPGYVHDFDFQKTR